MNSHKQISKTNINYFKIKLLLKKFPIILLFLSGLLFLPIQKSKSKIIFLKWTGKFEINRGELIKPDWETSYLTINKNGLSSTIDDKGIKRKGRTFIRRNSYTVTHRDKMNRVKAKYKIDRTHGTYRVDYPQTNKTLIGICQKSRG